MKLVTVPIEEAHGGILVHNISDSEGHKALPKGRLITDADIEKLRALGKTHAYVALLELGDVRENDAATRIARAAAGDKLELTQAQSGRVNVLAAGRGVLELNGEALKALNSIEGVTLATIAAHETVAPKEMIATVKTIGLALPAHALEQVERVSIKLGPAMWVRPLLPARVALVLTGSAEARERVERTFTGPIEARVQELGGRVVDKDYAAESTAAIAESIIHALGRGATAIILAGETSIMSVDDVTPRAIVAAGGRIEVFGAPVEPGNLLLLAYCGTVPVLGAPGCVKSRDKNVVDLVLPRLLAGERLSQADVAGLANGGLLV